MTLKQYEYILLHKTIDVFPDNAVVVQLAKHRPMNAREARLIAYLSQFKLNIRHVAGVRNYTADFLSRMCEDLDDKQIQEMRSSQNLIREEFIFPLRESEKATPKLVTKWLHDSTESQEDRFRGRWVVYNVHFGPIRRKAMNSTAGEENINNEQSLSSLNPEAAEYQTHECVYYDPVEESVSALDDHSPSDSFIPRRSSRIQDRLVNNRPDRQDISNVDRCTKVHASVHSHIKGDDDRSTSTSTLPPTVNTDDARPSNSQQEGHEPDEPASVHCRDSEQSRRSNVGYDGNDNAEMVRNIPAATDDIEQPLKNEVQQLQDSVITSD